MVRYLRSASSACDSATPLRARRGDGRHAALAPDVGRVDVREVAPAGPRQRRQHSVGTTRRRAPPSSSSSSPPSPSSSCSNRNDGSSSTSDEGGGGGEAFAEGRCGQYLDPDTTSLDGGSQRSTNSRSRAWTITGPIPHRTSGSHEKKGEDGDDREGAGKHSGGTRAAEGAAGAEQPAVIASIVEAAKR